MNIAYRSGVERVQFTVQIPKRVHAAVRRQALKNCRSVAGEIVARLNKNINTPESDECPCGGAMTRTTVYMPARLLKALRTRAGKHGRSTGRELVRLISA